MRFVGFNQEKVNLFAKTLEIQGKLALSTLKEAPIIEKLTSINPSETPLIVYFNL